MAYKCIRVSVCDVDSGTDELNRFLAGHRVDSVERRFVEEGQNSFWLFCIEYGERPAAKTPAAAGSARRKERIDYRDVLNEADFQTYLSLKELRQQIADEEKLAIYLIFTNEQLANIAQAQVATKEALKKIDGIGEARVDKYGDRVIEWLAKFRGTGHETGRKSVSANPSAGEPAPGAGQGPARKTPPA